jgi:hypothetical protein
MSTTQPYDAAANALNRLAVSWRSVAATLLHHGCTGVREEGAACPVAQYVRTCTDVDVVVDALTWRLDPVPPTGRTHGRLPLSVAEFVAAFDRGEHPELDRTQPEEP